MRYFALCCTLFAPHPQEEMWAMISTQAPGVPRLCVEDDRMGADHEILNAVVVEDAE
jgi:hypothetical protein